MSRVPEFAIWQGMKARCFNENCRAYRIYGGRGITICDEWKTDFMAFYNHIGQRPTPHHTVDRIDNDGDYRPGNVRWATRAEQLNNIRRNIAGVVDAERLTAAQAAVRYRLNASAIRSHLQRGRCLPDVIEYLRARDGGERRQYDSWISAR